MHKLFFKPDQGVTIYVRISTNKQQTDRQVVELKEYASKAGITITDDDIFTDIISGFKDGELRPQYSLLKQKIEAGEYQQILFSEFSRLDRKPSNLLRSIEYYQKHDVHLYFKKQNLWVKDKSDIASQIMISVLAVMSQYEIELFVARGIDGKISTIKNRGINDGGFTAYGYMTSTREKRLIINEAEAEIVRKIFVSFDEGKSSLDIAGLLNSQGIPSPYSSRIRDSMEQRKAKGLPEKEYARISEAVLDLSFLPLKIYFHSSIDRVRDLPLIPPTVKSAFALGSVALVLIIILVRCCQQTHLSGSADQDDE